MQLRASLVAFLSAEVVLDPVGELATASAYERYLAFCEEHDAQPASRRALGRAIADLTGIASQPVRRGGRWFRLHRGLRLRRNDEEVDIAS
jgi:hypothetical protein